MNKQGQSATNLLIIGLIFLAIALGSMFVVWFIRTKYGG